MNRLKLFFLGLILALLAGCQTLNKKDYQIGDANFNVQVTSYKLDAVSKKSLLIFAPTGGTNYIDRSYAKRFCSEGYDVYIMNSWTGDHESFIDLEVHQALYTRAQKAISLTLDQVKTDFVGLLGTSVGGLHAAVSASTQDRLNAVFVITAGAPITEVIVNSDQDAMVLAKQKRYVKYGFKSDADYLEALNKKFNMEPMLLGDGYKKKQLGMMIATEDTTVPISYQRQLQKFWNPRVTLTYDNNHFWTIVKTWLFETEKLLEFFDSSYAKMALARSI